MNIKNVWMKKGIQIAVLLMIAMVSFCVISKITSSAEFHAGSIEALESKKITVMELIAASAASSTAISLIPGDVGMPIANEISDISTYLLVVVCVITIEKYILTLSGFLSFSLIIPIACILGIIYLLSKRGLYKTLAIKFGIFGLAFFLLIPTSVQITNLIETTHSASIQQTIASAKENVEEVTESVEENKGILGGIINSVESATNNVVKKAETMMSRFVDAVAILIVTSCVIPILVVFCFFWLLKFLFHLNIQFPSPHKQIETKV